MPKKYIAGLRIDREATSLRPDLREFMDGGPVLNAALVAVVAGGRGEPGGPLRPSVTVAFLVSCVCGVPGCADKMPLTLDLDLENAVRLKESLEVAVDEPEIIEKMAKMTGGQG